MPTGTGKGFVIGELAKNTPFKGRVLAISATMGRTDPFNPHHIERATGEPVEIETASLRVHDSSHVDHWLRRGQCSDSR